MPCFQTTTLLLRYFVTLSLCHLIVFQKALSNRTPNAMITQHESQSILGKTYKKLQESNQSAPLHGLKHDTAFSKFQTLKK